MQIIPVILNIDIFTGGFNRFYHPKLYQIWFICKYNTNEMTNECSLRQKSVSSPISMSQQAGRLRIETWPFCYCAEAPGSSPAAVAQIAL